jgi:hypothetical protein
MHCSRQCPERRTYDWPLAKLLTRFEAFQQTSDPRIVGLPSALFDQISQRERAEFFQAGNVLPIDAVILDLEGVKEMIEREQSEARTDSS